MTPALAAVLAAMVAVVGRRWARRRLRRHLWRWLGRGLRRAPRRWLLTGTDHRRRRDAVLLLDPIELVAGRGDQLLDAGDVVVAIRIHLFHGVELGAQGAQRLFGGLRVGGILQRHCGAVDDDREGAQ